MTGLVILAYKFQYRLQSLLAMILVPGNVFKGKLLALQDMLIKNMNAHHKRNSKTALMFTLGTSFILFAGTIFSLQSAILVDNVRLAAGSDILGYSLGKAKDAPIDEVNIRKFLDAEKRKSNGAVQDYTLISYGMDVLPELATSAYNLAQYPVFNPKVFGIASNYLDVAYQEYVSISESRKSDESSRTYVPPASVRSGRPKFFFLRSNQDDRVQDFYNSTLKCRIMISTGCRDFAGLSSGDSMILSIAHKTLDTALDQRCEIQALVSKYPGFFFSSYRMMAPNSHAIIPIEDFAGIYRRVANVTFDPDFFSIPKQRILIRTRPGISKARRQQLADSIK